MCISDGLTV